MYTDYKALTMDVFHVQNKFRVLPSCFVFDLEDLLKLFKGNVLHKPGEIPLRTQEGPSAVIELIEFLKRQPSLSPFENCEGLCFAAQDHAFDIGPKGLVSHSGSSGSSMQSRIEKYGEWNGKIGESIEFGSDNARDVILNLAIDDGNMSRGHRKHIFSTDFKYVGVGVGPHKTLKHVVVLDYATEFSRQLGGSKKEINFGNLTETKNYEFQKVEPSSYNYQPQSYIPPKNEYGKIEVSSTQNKTTKIINGKKHTIDEKTIVYSDGSKKIERNEYIEQLI